MAMARKEMEKEGRKWGILDFKLLEALPHIAQITKLVK